MRILLPLLRWGKTDTHSLGKWRVPSRLDREAGWDPSSPSPSLAPACPSPIPGLPSSHIFLKPSISPPILCRTSRPCLHLCSNDLAGVSVLFPAFWPSAPIWNPAGGETQTPLRVQTLRLDLPSPPTAFALQLSLLTPSPSFVLWAPAVPGCFWFSDFPCFLLPSGFPTRHSLCWNVSPVPASSCPLSLCHNYLSSYFMLMALSL